ncbi:tRNA pseudouridine(32) synthase [Purpureocillium takamizusanense]|uniref:tRNA pseudouridine(32) synthase n=1 Tax=Purpureocillium takamizusanense TaxID=2060973 RepID=A0A9Q8QA59_9HYPO|nr:tRNA pseudouridine(32) synthase [Purpureocillium takamizusanense]UNI15506.1 tRNA pseudouridine(32) synthase [Purpureocillium takamizusanense]
MLVRAGSRTFGALLRRAAAVHAMATPDVEAAAPAAPLPAPQSAASSSSSSPPAAAPSSSRLPPAPAQVRSASPSPPLSAESNPRRKQKQTLTQRPKHEGTALPDPDVPLITPVAPVWPPPYHFDDDDGLRRVRPYHWTYNTYCKERWRGRALIDIFESEFRDRPVHYYRASMESGDIYVNGRRVGPDYIVRNGDLVSHTLHRHEPPVTADPVAIIHEDDEMIVINKPSGVPVHPAGRYKFNSVIEIMKADRGAQFMPYPCNRLDRLTSGIMFIAKSVRAAEEMGNRIKQRTVRKEYIARVVGDFPDGEVVCDQPILQISPKLGLNRVRANGKTARTVFKKLAYYPPTEQELAYIAATADDKAQQGAHDDDDTNATHVDPAAKPWLSKRGYSIVRCLPVTGRTHQIRVHLQYLGHPIQNDPIYANQRVWGFDLGQSDADGTHNTDEDVISRLSRMGKEEVAQAVVYYDEMVDKYEKRRAEKMTGELCAVCDTPLYSDPGAHELSLWLHSLRYEDAGGAWSYTSPLPKWALPPEGMAGPTTVGGMEELVDAVKDDNPEMAG